MECQFCKNKFSTKASLNHHIKTAKYCLKLQGKMTNLNYSCDGCGKVFSRKYEFNRHNNICNADKRMEKYKNKIAELTNQNIEVTSKLADKISLIEDLKKTIKELHDKLENIAIKAVQRPTTTNNNKTMINNFIQNMQPVTSDHLIDSAPNLTIEHVQKGASGYAEYALEYPLKDRIACVDYSRRKIKFKDKDGSLVTDPEMVKLAPMFFNSIKDKSSELVYSLNTPDMDSAMFEEVAKLFNTNADVKSGSTGVKSEFYHDFVKHVCSGSLVD